MHITLPHLKDAIMLSTLLRAVWEFNNVDLLYTLTGGGPAGVTTTLPLYVANTGIDAHDFGYALRADHRGIRRSCSSSRCSTCG